MQTKKRISGRNAAREQGKVLRSQKKVSENVQTGEKKVAEFITSSTRKPRHASTPTKRNGESVVEADVNTGYNPGHDLMSNTCGPMLLKECDEGADPCVSGTIFSPTFHMSRGAGEEISSGVSFIKSFQTAELNIHEDNGTVYSKTLDESNCGDMLCVDTIAVESRCKIDSQGAGLSSEVSAIYLAMKNSKLECVDEHGQDSMSTDVCVDEDDYEDFDDFDPYLFIKNLPALSSVVPTFRPVLLPKQTRSCPPTTLVLDLDETLVHSSLEPCDDADFTFPVNFNLQEHAVYVRCRPYLKDFLERVACLFEIIIFTASQSIYAEQLLNVLDPKRKLFRHRVYRESCVFVEGNYLKDLSVLGRDLARVIIIDNSPQAFGFQVDNGIPIESWFDDRSDQELLSLLPFLESLVGVEDVRPLIAKRFNLREKIAAAVYPPLISGRGDPFER